MSGSGAYRTWLLVMLGMPSTGDVNIAGQASPSHICIHPFMPPLHIESEKHIEINNVQVSTTLGNIKTFEKMIFNQT